jgi:NADPH2:quinone reductase
MVTAILAQKHGAPDVLEVADVDLAPPGKGQVRISVRAAGVNPGDAKELAGVFSRGGSTFPLRLGSEVSGVVSAVGELDPGDRRIEVGDEVVAFRVFGGYAAEVLAPATSVFPKPANLSWAEAAGLLHAGVVAFHMLEATHVTRDDVVIVHGASGSVGSMVVQLARLRGASVVGTGSARSHASLTALGAIPVTYGDGLVDRLREALPRPATVALDASGVDEALDASVALVSDRERIATIANYQHGMALGVRVLGMGPGPDNGADFRDTARSTILSLAAAGQVRVHVAEVFPLSRAADALSLAAGGGPGGKVILEPER